MNYAESLQYLHSVARFGSKPGLERVVALTAKIGHPERKLSFIHIAGTSGKGSTAAMTASVLRAAGYKTGLLVSPYVEEFRERVQIDGAKLSEESWADALTRIREDTESLVASGGPQPTEFEILIALALRLFAEHNCDICVLEVGMGGRFDATNVIENTLVAAVTPLSIDHTQYLGDTITQIAFEKCGIFKPGCTVVAAPEQEPEAQAVIEEQAALLDLPLVVPDLSKLEILEADLSGSRFRYNGQTLSLPLMGRHQIHNAVVSCEIIKALGQRGFAVSPDAVASGLRELHWGGRLEIVGASPLRLIDGAHNVGKFSALSESITDLLAGKRLIAVVAMSADKDIEGCLQRFAPLTDVLIATQYGGMRSVDADTLARLAEPYAKEVLIEADLTTAVRRARDMAKPDDVILVTGSLYLIGDAKRVLVQSES